MKFKRVPKFADTVSISQLVGGDWFLSNDEAGVVISCATDRQSSVRVLWIESAVIELADCALEVLRIQPTTIEYVQH